MSVSTAASSTPNPARCKDARRRCRNHWKRQAEVKRRAKTLALRGSRKELFVGNILSGALRPNAARQAMRSYQKRMEEFVETFNRTSNQTIDLFEKTLGVYQATSVPDAQRRVQDLIESSLRALRVNVYSALNTNTIIIDSWKELADRFGPFGQPNRSQ